MDTSLIPLFTIWVLLWIGVFSVCVMAIIMPKDFEYHKGLSRVERKKTKRSLMREPGKEYLRTQPHVWRSTIFGGLFALVAMWAAVATLALKYYIIAWLFLALASALYMFLGVVTPSLQYKYWSTRPTPNFTLLARDKFVKLLILRGLRSVFLTLIFLMLVIFNAQFFQILSELLYDVIYAYFV